MPAHHPQRAQRYLFLIGSYNYDLYLLGQILPVRLTNTSETKSYYYPLDDAQQNVSGYNDQYGTDYYENG